MSTGLVLEGGAMRGMYTAGVLDIFLDNSIAADEILGVSAGAVFGVNYLSKQRGRVIRYNKRFAPMSKYMGIKSLLTTGDIINKDFAYGVVPCQLDIFDQETYSQAKANFYAVATNMHTGQAEYIKINDIYAQMDHLRASASMPYVSKPVELDGKLYLDGGVADSIPVDKCIELGCDKIIVVLTRPKEYRKDEKVSSLPKRFYPKYPEFAEALSHRGEQYNKTLDKIEELEKEGKIFVIRPSRTVKLGRIERDPKMLQEMYDLGIEDAQACLSQLNQYLSK